MAQPFQLGILGGQMPVPGPLPVQGVLGAATVNPMLMAQGNEMRFLRGIRSSPWFSEFVKQYGEIPNLGRNADYDYRSAWAAGIRPERDPYDNNCYHWPSSLPDGQMLKSDTHPTAWKEHYMRATGKNPDAVGATLEDWLRMQR